MGINPIELSFESSNSLDSYKKVITHIVSLEGSISEKESEVYIKAKLGSKVKSRLKGFVKCDIHELPVDVFIDFTNNKIIVKDDSGPGIKWGVSKRISQNMHEVANKLKSLIEN